MFDDFAAITLWYDGDGNRTAVTLHEDPEELQYFADMAARLLHKCELLGLLRLDTSTSCVRCNVSNTPSWFILLQSIEIVLSMLFAGASFVRMARLQKIDNLLKITSAHREIWSTFIANPALSRVVDSSGPIERAGIIEAECTFVTFVVLHLNTVFEARRGGGLAELEGLECDVLLFFSSSAEHCMG